MKQLAIFSLILNAIGLVVLPILIRLGIIKPRSSPKERMKERIENELNGLLNADKNNTFIPVGKLGDILIQRTNPIFRKRFCEIFLESIRELDENEIIITDRSKIPISIEIGKQIKFPSKYHSKYFTYGSLRRISPGQYIGLNNVECRKYIESCDSSIQAHLKSFNSANQITTYKNKWL